MRSVTLPQVGEPLILDLLNTRPHTPDGPVDLLATPAGLAAWLTAQEEQGPGRIDPPGRAATSSDLKAVHAVRDHAAAAIDHARRGERPPAAALDGLSAAYRGAPAYPALAWDGTKVVATRRRTGSLGKRLAAQLAESATELLTDPGAIATVRQCQADDCVLLFVATNPRRQWCSASRCGNRARVARYYLRHKRD